MPHLYLSPGLSNYMRLRYSCLAHNCKALSDSILIKDDATFTAKNSTLVPTQDRHEMMHSVTNHEIWALWETGIISWASSSTNPDYQLTLRKILTVSQSPPYTYMDNLFCKLEATGKQVATVSTWLEKGILHSLVIGCDLHLTTLKIICYCCTRKGTVHNHEGQCKFSGGELFEWHAKTKPFHRCSQCHIFSAAWL